MTTATTNYKFLDLSHGRTRYIEAGTGQPVILIHGYPYMRSADDWQPNIQALATRYRVLAPDIVGWAPSAFLDQEYSFAVITDFIREFQDALGLKSSHVVGASMGGWIAGLLSYESPHRVEKCVQTGHNGIGALPNAAMSNWQAPTDEAITEWLIKVTSGFSENVEALVKERLECAREPGRLEAFAKLSRHMGDGVNRARYDLERRLPHITVPTLYVWGKDDNSFPVAEKARQLTPGSQLVVLACGHDVSIESPAEFNEAVLEFLG